MSRMRASKRLAGALTNGFYRFLNTAQNLAIFTHANTAARTYTLPDKTGTMATTDDAGKILQAVHTASSAVATGTTTTPKDDTIPQNTEGDEYMTRAITPANTNNRLLIEVLVNVANSSNTNLTIALFQDTTADALAATAIRIDATNAMDQGSLVHEMAAGTTSSTTFKIRIGADGAGTTTFNGASAARLYGGVVASYIRVTELST